MPSEQRDGFGNKKVVIYRYRKQLFTTEQNHQDKNIGSGQLPSGAVAKPYYLTKIQI